MRRREDDEDDVLEPAAADEDAVSDVEVARVEEDEAGKPDEEGVQRHPEDDGGEEDEEEEEEEEGQEPDAGQAVDKVEEREAVVPRGGSFFMHDDRMGGGRKPPPRKAAPGKKEEMAWCHDKFEELMREPEAAPRNRAESGRGGGKGGRGERGGRGAGRGRGARADAPPLAVPAPDPTQAKADARVAGKSGGPSAVEPALPKSRGKGGRGSRAVQPGRGNSKRAPNSRFVAEPLPSATGGAGAQTEPTGGVPLSDAAGGYADASVMRAAGQGMTGDAPQTSCGQQKNGYRHTQPNGYGTPGANGKPHLEGSATAHPNARLNRSAISFQPQHQLPPGLPQPQPQYPVHMSPQPMAACAAGPAVASVPAAGSGGAMQTHWAAEQHAGSGEAHWAGEHHSVPAEAHWAAEQHGMMSPYGGHGYTPEYTDLGQHYYEGSMQGSASMGGGMGMGMASTIAGGMGGAYIGSPGYGDEEQSGYRGEPQSGYGGGQQGYLGERQGYTEQQSGYGMEQQSGYGGDPQGFAGPHGSGGERTPATAYHTSGLFTPEHMTRLRYEQSGVGSGLGRRPNLELNIEGYSLSTTRMGTSVLVPTGTRKVTIEKPAEA